MDQTISRKKVLLYWFAFIIVYLFICSSAALIAAKAKENNKANVQRVRAQQIQKLLSASKAKGFTENKVDDIYNESLYNQGGSINPNLRHRASAQNNGEGDVREYQRQLAEYRLQVAQERQKILEERRKQEEYEAKQRALIEQEKQEHLRAQQELKKSQNIAPETEQILGSSKTFTEPKTQTNSATKSSVNVKPATPQKTQIGTLKKSKLG